MAGSPEKLLQHYETWKASRGSYANPGRIELPLGWTKGRSSRFTRGSGRVLIDLESETLSAQVRGLAGSARVDLWLVEHCPSVGVACSPESDALFVHAGGIELVAGGGFLRASIEGLDGFQLEQIVVSDAGRAPAEGGLLFGTPGLFERLYSSELRGGSDSLAGGLVLTTGLPASLGPTASAGSFILDDLETLVALGEDLFFNETFDGNGRTCGTCHPAENNFTIDVPFISALPPTDPLFVAETVPALDSSQNGGLLFENPVLMRQFGLIVENLDGFDDLASRFTMRSVQHTLGMGPHAQEAGKLTAHAAPAHRLEWRRRAGRRGTARVLHRRRDAALPADDGARARCGLPSAHPDRAQRHGGLPALPGTPRHARARPADLSGPAGRSRQGGLPRRRWGRGVQRLPRRRRGQWAGAGAALGDPEQQLQHRGGGSSPRTTRTERASCVRSTVASGSTRREASPATSPTPTAASATAPSTPRA